MKILVIQQSDVTEVLLSTIIIELLKEEYPYAKIHYLINTETLPVIEHNPFIDEIINFTTVLKRNKLKLLFFLRKIKHHNYDAVVDAHSTFNSAIMTYFSEAPRRIGFFNKLTAFIYTQPLSLLHEPIHGQGLVIENRLKLLMPFQIRPRNIYPKIYLKEEEEDLIGTTLLNSQIDAQRPLVVVDLLGKDEKLTYPKKNMAQLLDKCMELKPNLQFVFYYEPHQKNEAEYIFKHTKPETRNTIFMGLDIFEIRSFFALINYSDFVLGNQGLPAVAAKALNIPTFTISSPSISREYWFSKEENEKHRVMHPEELIPMFKRNVDDAVENPIKYYKRMTPELIHPHLESFMKKWVKS